MVEMTMLIVSGLLKYASNPLSAKSSDSFSVAYADWAMITISGLSFNIHQYYIYPIVGFTKFYSLLTI